MHRGSLTNIDSNTGEHLTNLNRASISRMIKPKLIASLRGIKIPEKVEETKVETKVESKAQIFVTKPDSKEQTENEEKEDNIEETSKNIIKSSFSGLGKAKSLLPPSKFDNLHPDFEENKKSFKSGRLVKETNR